MSQGNRQRRPKRRANLSGATALKFDSSLYNRANGFMLGCFLALIRYRFARDSFQFHRRRMGEFLHEAGINIELPASRHEYSRRADKLLQDVILACRGCSAELADFVLLGSIAVIDASLRLSEEPIIEDLRSEANEVLGRYKFDGKALYDRFLAYVRRSDDEAKEEGRVGVCIETFLTPAMDLLTSTIEPLEADKAMCFVAMPFKPPYANYFELLYRPLASQLECGAFSNVGRAFG